MTTPALYANLLGRLEEEKTIRRSVELRLERALADLHKMHKQIEEEDMPTAWQHFITSLRERAERAERERDEARAYLRENIHADHFLKERAAHQATVARAVEVVRRHLGVDSTLAGSICHEIRFGGESDLSMWSASEEGSKQ